MPRSAAAGTVSTPVALSIVIVTSALIPDRTVAGAFVSATVTAYETTPLLLVAVLATGEIEVTVPVDGRVDRRDGDGGRLAELEGVQVALDDVGRDLQRRTTRRRWRRRSGPRGPWLMLTAVTTPSIGALSVPRAIWAIRSFRVCAAWETWFCAL